jgi:hypothetical protein
MFQHVMRDDQVVAGIGQRDLSDVDPVRDTRLVQIRSLIERVVAHPTYNGFLGREVQNALAVKRVATMFLYPKLGEPVSLTAAALRTARPSEVVFPR